MGIDELAERLKEDGRVELLETEPYIRFRIKFPRLSNHVLDDYRDENLTIRSESEKPSRYIIEE